MTSKNPALYYCLQACHESRGGELQDFLKEPFFTVVVHIWQWQAGPEDMLMRLQFPQRWHKGPVETVPACFSFPLTSFPHTDAASCVHQSPRPSRCSGGRLFFILPSSTAGSSSLFFVRSDEIWATLADTKEQCEHVHYKSNHLERHNSAKRRGCDSCQLSQEKSMKFTFSLCSIWKSYVTAQWKDIEP